MSTDYLPYLLAFSAAVVFSLSSIVFTNFSRQVSALWMNTVKCLVATIGFLILNQFFYGWHPVENNSLYAFFISGFIGLGIGDIFLLAAFAQIGPSRTLMVFGFTPLLTGLMGYMFFGQEMTALKFTAIFFMLLCLFIFSLEGYKKKGSWEIKGLLFALTGVLLDASGIGLTRYGFDLSPEVLPTEGNFYRCLGAIVAFILISRFKPIKVVENFKTLTKRQKYLVLVGSLGGTFLSLWLFLSAVRIGHLASVSAIGVTGPFLAALFETIFYKEKPSKYLIAAGASFACGFFILLSS